MRQQVRCHEAAVAVAADADAIAIGDAHLHDLVDRRLRARHELLDVRVVGRLARADDRHRRVVEDGVAGQQQEHVRAAADRGERVRRSRDLARRVGVAELARIGPHDHRHARSLLVARRQVQRARQRDAVVALVGDVLAEDVAHLRLRILELRDRALGVGAGVARVVVRRVLLRLVARHELRHLVVQRRDERLERFGRRAEDPLASSAS